VSCSECFDVRVHQCMKISTRWYLLDVYLAMYNREGLLIIRDQSEARSSDYPEEAVGFVVMQGQEST
jgi:hypothetical protein